MTEQQSFDELALLGDDLGSGGVFTGDINEDELLGLNENANQATDNKPVTITQSNDEIEQLDYDEDEEAKPREKFSSERKKESPANTENSDSNQKSGTKCFVNPKFRNRLPNSNNPQFNGPLPSLLSQPILPPQMMGPPPVDINVRMVMMNSLRPIVPQNPMFRHMGPPPMGFSMQNQGFPPMGMPPNMIQNRPMGSAAVPITAQIGQLSTVIQQQDDGTITFRTKIPPVQQPRVTVARAGCSEPGQSKDWNSMVDDFIKNPSKSRKRDRRSRSISSYSNSSYSGSYSEDSYSSTSSRSPSPRHRRRARSPSRKRSSYRRSSYRRSHRRERPRRSSPRRRRGSRDDLKNTIECAEAVGVDQDYVRKLEEQKKLREEVARQKYQRDGGSRNSDDKRSSRRNEPSSRQRRNEEERPRSEPKSSTQSKADSNPDNKVKPYLVVVINNLGNLSDAYKRLKMIAQAVGQLKRAWQTSEDSVSIIFEQHEDAKNFMLQYHMKQFNGVTLSIGLEKVFLNLASIP